MKIPVRHDPRKFEDQRKDLVSVVEKNVHAGRGSPVRTIVGSTEPSGSGAIQRWIGDQPMWSNEINNWVSNMHREFEKDLDRMRRGFFDLSPMESWGFRPDGDLSIFEHVNRRMEQMHNEMMKIAGADWSPTRFPGFRGLDIYKDAFEVGEDGKVHFTVRFDVKNFPAESIEVRQEGRNLIVHAKVQEESRNGKKSKEFCQALLLPASVDFSKLNSTLSKDGILTCEAPVKKSDYNRITLDADRNVAIRPRLPIEYKSQHKATEANEPNIITDRSGNKRMHLEVPIDPIYSADDIRVKVENGRLKVSGRLNNNTIKNRMYKTFDDHFSRTFNIPKAVDPMSVDAELRDSTLIIEADL